MEYAGRPANHNELMIGNWRKTVREGQTVLHLGDVLMGQQQLWATIGWLPGVKFVLDSGNHDEPHKRNYLEQQGWGFIPEFSIEYRGWTVYFTHKPLWTIETDPDDNTAVKFEGTLELLKRGISKSINVHGHIHEKPAPSQYHINVSVEQINYTPVNLKELLDRRIDELEAS